MTDDERDTPDSGISYDRETQPSTDDQASGFGSETDTPVDSAPENQKAEPTDDETEPVDDETESTDGDAESRSVTDVETIVIDPEAIIDALAYNGQEDIGPDGKAVFVLSPPFGERIEPTLRHLGDDSTEGKADDEIHVRPFRFVAEGQGVLEQRPTRQLAKEELEEDDPDEAVTEAWIDQALETWKTHVRESLVETVDIYSSHGMAFIDVEHRDDVE